MAKARHVLSIQTVKTIIYNTMVYLHLTYCSVIWTSNYPTRLESIPTIQKKLVRMMTFSSYQEKSKPLFQSLKILDRYELNKYLIALFVHSYFSNNLPKYFNKYFILIKNIIVMILVQHQKYLLITKGQFWGNFH